MDDPFHLREHDERVTGCAVCGKPIGEAGLYVSDAQTHALGEHVCGWPCLLRLGHRATTLDAPERVTVLAESLPTLLEALGRVAIFTAAEVKA